MEAVLRNKFGSDRGKVTEEQRIPHSTEIYNLYSTRNIIIELS
jgi:hypothetical protein